MRASTDRHGEASLPLIGWREAVLLPDLKAGPIVAKIDTGARSAALHADDIKVERTGRGMSVSFKVATRESSARAVACELPLVDLRRVRSSSGHAELRPVVLTRVEIGAVALDIEVTLTSRTDMGAAMLIGRQAIRDRFLVDPRRTHLLSRRPKRAPP